MRGEGRRFFWCFGAMHGMSSGYATGEPSTYWLPAIQKRGRLGVELFETQTASIRQAQANVERLAAETGRSPAQVVEDLKAARDAEGARAARRFAVSAPFVPFGAKP